MQITQRRFVSDNDTTISLIYVDNRFMCFGLEDEYRPDKIAGETRIDAGTYPVTLRTEGGMTRRYATKFPGLHQGMLWIRDIPNFEYVYFHVGNTDDHTEGCVLVGHGAMTRRDDMSIQVSMDAYRMFYAKVVDAAANDNLWLTIIDEDREAA